MKLKTLTRWSPTEFLKDRNGASTIFVAFGLSALIGMAALAVDMSYFYVIRGKLQAAADAAALAAVTELADADKARSKAQEYATKNLSTSVHGTTLANSDVVLGNWDTETKTFTPGGAPENAVFVTVRRSQQNNNDVPTFFARIMGVDTVDIETSATAMLVSNGDCFDGGIKARGSPKPRLVG